MEFLGIFPSLETRLPGGIQISGRLAWDAVSTQTDGTARVLIYDPAGSCPRGNGRIVVRTRWGAALRSLFVATTPETTVLVWHLGLLKLIPFLRGPKPRIVLFLHGIEAWKPQSARTRRLTDRVNLFLTNSDFTWRRFLEARPDLKDRPHATVHLGIGDPAELSLPAARPVAAMISRLARSEDYKGHREVIRAWSEVRRRVPDAILKIMGDGDLRPDLEALARESGGANSIQFLGIGDDVAKEALLREARCLLMPSRGEGFGLAYAEAMRLGRPCLVSGLDAGSEIVNPPEAGLATDPNDLRALASSIVQLVSEGEAWRIWSTRACLRYEAEFTAGHFHDRLIQALGEACR